MEGVEREAGYGVECVTPQTKNPRRRKGDNDSSEQTQSGLGLPAKGLPRSESQASLVPADRLLAAAPVQRASYSHFLAERISTVLITSAFFFFKIRNNTSSSLHSPDTAVFSTIQRTNNNLGFWKG